MLEEKQSETKARLIGEDGLPVVELDQAYHDRIAEHVRAITGEYPIWYADTPEERATRLHELLDELREEQRAAPLPTIPLEYLTREHLYD